ncbi:MAG: DUF3616 domain-containing protein [Gammaproteobacteria bacterium]|nr:DUF3616 domain-containing protein [Gammaproteobacteria bacterium]
MPLGSNITLIRRAGMLALVLTGLLGQAALGQPPIMSLGGYPVCEASAAIAIPCPDGKPCILVADNEIRDALFRFPIVGGQILVDQRTTLPFAAKRRQGKPVRASSVSISDVEALARLDDRSVLIVGSHSRNKECKSRKNRLRYVAGSIEADGIGPGAASVVTSKKKLNCSRLFGKDPDNWSAGIKRLCKAISQGEKAAQEARRETSSCADAEYLNIEGAVSALVREGERETWFGLRAPLVGQNAVLARLKSNPYHLQFDRTLFVDLGGRGIRELTVAGTQIWGIAGPTTDKGAHSFQLFRFPIDALSGARVIKPKVVEDPLPPSSEGLVVTGNFALVLIDGSRLRGSQRCRKESKYVSYRVTR